MADSIDTSALASRLDDAVAQGVGGLAWAVSVGDDVQRGAAGWLDADGRSRPATVDAIFRIASVTKPIAAVAALQLVDEGLVELDEPIDGVLPELADRRVLVEPHGPIDGPTVAAERRVTLRDLLSSRSGDGMDFRSADEPIVQRMWDLGIGPGPKGPDCSSDEFVARLATLPLADQPGHRWRYHVASDVAGVFVERVRGASLHDVLTERVFGPLGMVDTGFWVPPDRLDRFGVARMSEDGAPLAVWDEPDGRWALPPACCSGAAGLVSTTADLVAFGRMLLRHGAGPDGRQVLSTALVEAMRTDQLTDEQRVDAFIEDDTGALSWGLGIGVRHGPASGGWPSAGSWSWDGGLGSHWIVDPANDLVAVLLMTDEYFSTPVKAAMADFDAAIGAAVSG
jgi:CubicO group peptidase (beta-lactamase class C family)